MSDAGKAVFLSYASQDAEAARHICEALRGGGVEVWFDADGGLEHGDEWDAKIRRQIKECVLFLPIVSANTQARHEGYFRIEWELAAQRAMGIASGVPFILPVVIDDTREPDALVPDRFRTVQWTKLPGGEVPPAVLQRFLKLWSHRTGVLKHEATKALGAGASLDGGGSAPDQEGRGRATPLQKRVLLAAGIVALIAMAAVAGFLALRPRPQTHDDARRSAAPSTNPAPATLTEAQKLVAQAQRVYASGDEVNRENLSLADDLVQQALKLDPAEPTAWQFAARLSYVMVWQQIDNSDERREAMQRQAARAVALAPNSVDAQVVALNARMAGISWVASGDDLQQGLRDVERELTALAAREPKNWQVQRALGMAWRFLNRPDDSISAMRRAVELSGGDSSVTADLVNVLERRKQLNEAEAVVAAGLARKPNARLLAADVFFKTRWRGDLAGAEAAIASWPGWLLQDDRGLFMVWQTFFWKREPDKALAFANRFPRDYLHDAFFAGPRAVLTARAYEMAGDVAAAQADWRSVAQAVGRELSRRPEDPSALYWQAWALARLGQRDEARALCRVLLQRGRSNRAAFLKGTNLAPLLLTAGLTEDALADVQTQITTFNDSNALTRAVLELDPAYDSIRNDPRFRRLVASAPAPAKSTAATATAAPDLSAAVSAKADPKSVVVLPFANLSGDPAQEYFSDGLTEEILNALARERDLRVVPRTSAFSFKGKNLPLPEIARALNVAQVVEGSVRRAGNTVRIDCTLTRVADGFAQPLPQFEREMKDASGIFALEDDVARAVVRKLTRREETVAPVAVPTRISDAYDAYLRGRDLMNRTSPSWPKAVEALRRAVELDPLFALAWADLGQLSASLYAYGFDGDALAAGGHAIDEALRLQPDLPEAHFARAVYLRASNAPPAAVERELALAESMRPDAPDIQAFRSSVEFAGGDEESGLKLMQRAVDLDPRNGTNLNALGNLLTSVGRYAEAEAIYQRSFEILGSSIPLTNRARVYFLWKGDRARAARTLDEAPEEIRGERYWTSRALLLYAMGDQTGALAAAAHMRPRSEFFRIRPLFTAKMREALGDAAGAHNDYLAALPLAEQQRDEFPAAPEPYAVLGSVYAGLGRKAEALAAARKAIEVGQPAAITSDGRLPRTGLAAVTLVDSELDPFAALAQIMARFGMTDEALAIVKKAVAVGRWRRNYLLLVPDWAVFGKDPRFREMAEEAPL